MPRSRADLDVVVVVVVLDFSLGSLEEVANKLVHLCLWSGGERDE